MLSHFVTFILGVIFCKILPYLRQRWFAAFVNYYDKGNDASLNKVKSKYFKEITALKKSGKEPVTIVEIGVGAGANFKFYPEGCHLIAVDSNPNFKKYYNSCRFKFPNIKTEEIIIANGENLPMIASGTADVVVITQVLCSVQHPTLFLQEVKRILAPGGKLYFLEHVKEWDSEKHYMRQWAQEVLSRTHIWATIFDNCCLNLDTLTIIKDAGFSQVSYERLYVPNIENKFVFQVSMCLIVGSATR